MGGSSLAPEVFRRSFGDAAGCRCTCSTRRTPRRSRRWRTRSTSRARCSSSPRSPAARSRRCRSSSSSTRARATARTTSRSPTRAVAGEARRRARLPARVRERPGDRRALLGAVVLRPRPRRADRRSTSARCSTPRWPPRRRASSTRATPGCGSARRSASSRCTGRDKLTFVVDEPLESFGLWVEQLVAESTGKQGRGILPIADEPLVDPAAYGADRVFLHLAVGDEDKAAKVAALRAAGHPRSPSARTGPTTSARVLRRRVRHRGRRLGARHQPVRPAQRAGGQGQHPARARRGLAGPRPGRRRRAAGSVAPPRYVAIMAYLPYSDEVERAPRGCASGWSASTAWRRPSATGRASCTRPASSTRAARRRRVRADHGRAGSDLEVPGEPYTFGTLIRAQADGDLQTLRSHGLDAVRAGRRSSDAARLRGPRQDGREHGPPHPPRLGPQGRRVRLQRGQGQGGRGPRRRRRGLARGPRGQAREAADGLDHGPGRRSDRSRRSTRWPKLLEPGDTIVDGGNARWHDDVRRASGSRERHPLHRRRHLRRRLGPGGRLLHDGRRPRGGRRPPGARSSTCSRRPTAGGASATRARATS